MDPSLLKEREAFKKKAYAIPTVESKKRKEAEAEEVIKKPKKVRIDSPAASSSHATFTPRDIFSYKSAVGASQHNFGILAKIVKHMKQRFALGDSEPLSLDELLDETNQLDIGNRQRTWLESEALRNNPKIELTQDGKYAFKPVFKLRDRKTLLKLLEKYDIHGKGGIMLDDVMESLPNAERVLKQLGDSVLIINRPADKKKVLFFNDKSLKFNVEEDFQKMWRSVAVDSLDEQKIQDYLEMQGLNTMQDVNSKRVIPIQKRKKTSAKKRTNFKKTNVHVADLLQDYSEKT